MEALKIELNQLWKVADYADFLIVGTPKGVGFSTFVAEWSAENLFMKDNYSILIITQNNIDSMKMLDKIEQSYKYYHHDGIIRDGVTSGIIVTKKKNNSIVGAYSLDEINKDVALMSDFDLIIVDSDDFKDNSQNFYAELSNYTKKMVIGTHDSPQSAFYTFDWDKVIVTSKYNKVLKRRMAESYSTVINFDRHLEGKFVEYEK